MRKQQFGPLNAYVAGGTDGEAGGEGPVVVLMHGFGAPGFDLVDLGQMLELPSDVRFVFPEAPLSLGPGFAGGRAWWMIDLSVLEARERGEVVDRSRDVPEALPAISARVQATLDAVEAQLGVDGRQIVLGGFSQGSMLALDVALTRERPLAGLVLWSSTLIAAPRWEPCLGRLSGLPVLQSHGTGDPLLPYAQAEKLAGLLGEAGADLRFVRFAGGHEIPPAVLGETSALIRKALKL